MMCADRVEREHLRAAEIFLERRLAAGWRTIARYHAWEYGLRPTYFLLKKEDITINMCVKISAGEYSWWMVLK